MQPLINFLGSIICFIPAIAILYYILDKNEDCFEEKKIFLSLLIGFFLGLIAAIMEMFGFFTLKPNIIYKDNIKYVIYSNYLIMSIFVIALFQNALKSLVLSWKRFRQRTDTAFYGASLGLGFGALYSFISFSVFFQNFNDYRAFISAIFFIIGILFLHCSFGIILGYGSYREKIFSYYIFAVILQIILNIIFFYGNTLTTQEELVLPAIITFLYGFNLFLYVYKNIIPECLPEKIKKERRRKLRKELL